MIDVLYDSNSIETRNINRSYIKVFRKYGEERVVYNVIRIKKVEALLLKNHDIMNKVINFVVDN